MPVPFVAIFPRLGKPLQENPQPTWPDQANVMVVEKPGPSTIKVPGKQTPAENLEEIRSNELSALGEEIKIKKSMERDETGRRKLIEKIYCELKKYWPDRGKKYND